MTLEQVQTQMMKAVKEEDYDTALRMARKTVQLSNNEKKAWCILNEVDILMKMQRHEEAGKVAIEAGKILQNTYGPDSYEYAYVCLYLGKVYFHLNKYEVSRHCLEFFVDAAVKYIKKINDPEEKYNVELLLEDARIGILANNELLDYSSVL